MTDPSVFVGVDLGTSGLKALAVGADGSALARAAAGYSTHRPETGASQQAPADWRAAATTALRALAAQVPAATWAGIGLSAMLPTLVTLDESGAPMGPALTWEDSRAEGEGERLRAACGGSWIYERTGQWVDGRYLLPMLLRLQRVEPDRVRRTAFLAGAKDHLFHWLTGVLATDPSTAAGFGCYGLRTGEWLPDVLAQWERLAGLVAPRLPQLRPAISAEPLLAGVAAQLGLPAGIPVSLGAADSVLAAQVLGLDEPGSAAYVAGTSTVVLGVSDTLRLDPLHRYLVTPMPLEGTWGFEMDLLATGSAVRWLADLLGLDVAGVMRLAATADLDGAPVFLPYLAPGEQGALWDPTLTGTVTGLGLQHGAKELAAGLVAGIVLESRRCLEVLAEATGASGPVLLSGSSATDPDFRQALADATGRRLLDVDQEGPGAGEFSARGAAGIAAMSGGVRLPNPTRPARVWLPQDTAKWDRAAARHDKALSALRGATG